MNFLQEQSEIMKNVPKFLTKIHGLFLKSNSAKAVSFLKEQTEKDKQVLRHVSEI